jgi:hypothetical protein
MPDLLASDLRWRCRGRKTSHRVPFRDLPLQEPMAGVRHRFLDRDGTRLRWVEYTDEMESHWCTRGHVGVTCKAGSRSGSVELVLLGAVGDADLDLRRRRQRPLLA